MSDFTGVTFSYQSAAAADDAIVRRAILPDGILTGCAVSYSGTTLTLARGHLIVCGRQIRIPQPINYAVTDATSGFARLLLSIDLTKTSSKDTFEQVYASIQYATSEDGFDALIQSDINDAGTLYQLPVCVVSLGTGGITGIVSQLEQSKAEGGGLNFKIVGGLTQPNKPDENMIWVVTDDKIPSWYIDAEAPADPEDGAVWITMTQSGDIRFNAAKQNVLTVYPALCQQYISATWTRKAAYIYKSDKWVQFSSDWDGTLYDSGDEYEYITGGWASQKFNTKVSGTGTMSKDATCITLTAQNSASISAYTVNKIDLTDYSTLYVRIISLNKTVSWRFQARIIDGLSPSDYDSYIGYVDIGSGAGTYSIDVSGITGEHYISVDEWCTDSFSYVMKFDKVWLE